MTHAQQLGDLTGQPRDIARRFRRHRDVIQLRQIQQLLRRRVRHVDGIELVVTGRRLHHPGGAGDDADDLERLVPEHDFAPHRGGAGTKQLIGHHLAQHHDLRATVLFALGEEPSAGKGPRPFDRRHHHVRAVHAREPAFVLS